MEMDENGFLDNDRFIHDAKRAVAEADADKWVISVEDLYVVWFAKTLQNWKALISTDAVDRVYWEVTYNGDKQEAYVDCYHRNYNKAIPMRSI